MTLPPTTPWLVHGEADDNPPPRQAGEPAARAGGHVMTLLSEALLDLELRPRAQEPTS